MSRSFKLDVEERIESFKVAHSGNARKKLAADKERIRRANKRGIKARLEKEVEQEYAREN
jgi:hypothetical protein